MARKALLAVSHWRLPLHVLAAAGSTLLLLLVTIVLAWNAYSSSRAILSSAADEAIQRLSISLKDKAAGIVKPARHFLDLLSVHDLVRARSLDERLAAVPMASTVFASSELLDAWYVAYPDGEFVLFRPLRDDALKERVGAPKEASLLVQAQTRDVKGAIQGEYIFYGPEGRLLQRELRPQYQFDPRTRPWYVNAMLVNGQASTPPYLFFTTRSVGITLSRKAAGRSVVVGLDATLDALGKEVSALKLTPGSPVAFVDAKNRVLASSGIRMPVKSLDDISVSLPHISALQQPAMEAAARLPSDGVRRLSALIAGERWELISVPLPVERAGHSRVLMAVPHEELFKGAQAGLRRQILAALLLLALSVPFGIWITQKISHPLRLFAEETRRVAAFDFSPSQLGRSHILEVDMLATSTAQMRETISRFLDVSAALSSETRLEKLLATVLHDVAETVGAASGALYLFEAESRTLQRVQYLADTDSTLSLYPEMISRDQASVHPAAQVVELGASVRAPAQDGTYLFAVPLFTLGKNFLGSLVLEVSQDPGDAADRERKPLWAFIETLSSTAAVAIETRKLIEAQKNLLDGMVQLVAGAIDAKSPYTGGHCQRVPVITQMLVQAAHDANEGPLRDFHMSEADWEALHIGAWLHDCGKLTTPEYVVDKATKLETLYNRIHEIRMRFELLKRDAQIACLEACNGGELEASAVARRDQMWRTLDDEFAFVAGCNAGGEFLDPLMVTRLREIGERRWLRTLDDRLGLSRDEARMFAGKPAVTLPVEERLLMDKPEHMELRRADEMIPPDNSWGFSMKVPEHRFNRGELHNLEIARGTLTAEERYLINEHIVQTIIMLGRLPFPVHLRGVPEIAGGHHERMDGRGYPRGLKGEQMSIPARIMAIADVFEALTAADRPYKNAKTLSASLKIMAQMVREQHLDGELFRLFIESGVYLDYARKYLLADQFDEVDVAALLA